MNIVVLKSSKKKALLPLLGSVAFVCIGLWITFSDDFGVAAKVAGVLSILFFGLCFFVILYKLLGASENLTLDGKGITSNIVNAKFGPICWKDIEALEVIDVSGTKLLLVFVINKEKYLSQTSEYQQKISKANVALYGTPFVLSSVSLDCNFDYMRYIIIDRLEYFNSKAEKNEY